MELPNTLGVLNCFRAVCRHRQPEMDNAVFVAAQMFEEIYPGDPFRVPAAQFEAVALILANMAATEHADQAFSYLVMLSRRFEDEYAITLNNASQGMMVEV